MVDSSGKANELVTVPCSVTIDGNNHLHLVADLQVYQRLEKLKNGIKDNSDIKLVQKAVNNLRDIRNILEGVAAGEDFYPDTILNYCEEAIESLVKIKGIL